MRLIEFIQKNLTDIPLGGSRGSGGKAVNDATAYEDLRRVQATNELYFKTYWATLIVVFLATVVIALVYREEMGGLATVLGVGGIVQGGLVLRLSAEWKEKARVDIVSVLTRRLSPEQLQVVLKDLLGELSGKHVTS
jgi:hypothetical protein